MKTAKQKNNLLLLFSNLEAEYTIAGVLLNYKRLFMNNSTSVFPSFSTICPDDIEPAISQLLTQNKATFAQLLAHEKYTWDTLLAPIEEMEDHLGQVWAPISHL